MTKVVGSIVVALVLIQASADLPPITRVPIAERLWLVEIFGPSFDPFVKEDAELLKACGDPGQQWGRNAAVYYACTAKNTRPARYRIATLHAAPSGSSPVVASIYYELKIGTDGQRAWVNVDRASRPGERLPWPDGFVSYGTHVAGAQRRGDWVRLLTSLPVDGWLRVVLETSSEPHLAFYGRINPLTGRIVELSPLTAQWPGGRRGVTLKGSFLIQKIDGAFIEFREEIPSDFACGDPVIDPVPVPPTLRAATSEFFNPDGSPRFHEKYTKGC